LQFHEEITAMTEILWYDAANPGSGPFFRSLYEEFANGDPPGPDGEKKWEIVGMLGVVVTATPLP
jgi:hypothetical protein